MRKRSSSSATRRSSTTRRRSENLRFDEFGFAVSKRKDQKVHQQQRCHEYSYPQLSSVRVKELCELLSYWNGSSFICKSQIERFIRLGIPPSLRGRVWKCLLATDSLREGSEFSYQKCLLEVRGPLVDLGVSEYGILSAIATLSETQNDLDLNPPRPSSAGAGPAPCYSVDDIALFRQIALDLRRSFPTHRSLMGDSPEAIEGQAKLFRVLIAYAKYNPQVGYSQGMSYIAAVLLMQLGEEEEAFWALTALLDKPKYLAQLFDLSLAKVRHQVKVFDQFLKHRKPKLSKHLESVGVSSVHFVMPWFLALFTSLPCWDSVLAVWDLIILHGLSAVFRSALTVIDLLEPRLMDLSDEGAVLPLLLRLPVDVAQYSVLVPALWETEVQDWELKCMSSLVLDENHHGPKTEQFPEKQRKASVSTPVRGKEEEASPAPSRGQKPAEKESVGGAKSVLNRVMRLAQRYLFDPRGRQRAEEKGSQAQGKSRQRSPVPGRVFRSRTSSASQTKTQIRSRRRSQQGGRGQQPAAPGSSGDVTATDTTVVCVQTDRAEQSFRRAGTGPVGKASRHHGNHNLRLKSLRALRSGRNPASQASSSVAPSPPRSSTLPPPSGDRQQQRESPRMAFLKELSSRHQISVPFRNVRESQLI